MGAGGDDVSERSGGAPLLSAVLTIVALATAVFRIPTQYERGMAVLRQDVRRRHSTRARVPQAHGAVARAFRPGARSGGRFGGSMMLRSLSHRLLSTRRPA